MCWGSELWVSCLYDSCFLHWATSQPPAFAHLHSIPDKILNIKTSWNPVIKLCINRDGVTKKKTWWSSSRYQRQYLRECKANPAIITVWWETLRFKEPSHLIKISHSGSSHSRVSEVAELGFKPRPIWSKACILNSQVKLSREFSVLMALKVEMGTLAVVVHTFNSSALEANAGRSEASLIYRMSPRTVRDT